MPEELINIIDPRTEGWLRQFIERFFPSYILRHRKDQLTILSGATSFNVTSNYMVLTGAAAVTIAQIIGGYEGQKLILEFKDANITLDHNGTGALNTMNLGADIVSSANSVIDLICDGVSWRKYSTGVTDHGALSGLLDDDHTQYYKAGRVPDHDALGGLADDDHTQYLRTDGSRAYSGVGNGFKDEDNMASNSATAAASQQSIKAYVDAQVAGLSAGNFLGIGDATANKTYYHLILPVWVTTTGNDVWDDVGVLSYVHYGTMLEYVEDVAPVYAISHNTIFPSLQFNGTKKIIVEFVYNCEYGAGESGFGLMPTTAPMGNYDDQTVDACCFTANQSTVYAHTSDEGVGHTETQVQGNGAGLHLYRIEFTPGVNAKFYVDGALLATHTTNLPNGANPIRFGFGSTANATGKTISNINVSIER